MRCVDPHRGVEGKENFDQQELLLVQSLSANVGKQSETKQWAKELANQDELDTELRLAREAGREDAERCANELRRQEALERQISQEERELQKEEARQKRIDSKRKVEREKLKAFLIAKGYGDDVNASRRKTLSQRSYYPLHDAVAMRDVKLVQLLLAAGADPLLRSSSGKTPLEKAKRMNFDGSLDKICELLAAASGAGAQLN